MLNQSRLCLIGLAAGFLAGPPSVSAQPPKAAAFPGDAGATCVSCSVIATPCLGLPWTPSASRHSDGAQHLRQLVMKHVFETDSAWGRTLLTDYRDFLGKFWLVKPKAASLDSLIETLRRAA